MADSYLDDEVEDQRNRIHKAVEGAREIRLKPRTKWEIAQLQKSMAQHKDNIVQKQTVWGKEFKGNAYVAKPAEVLFTDFVVGEQYTAKFSLTNVSFTFNAFRSQEMDVSFRDFFQITFTPQSYMSAGMACEITVVFLPKKNQDIDTCIPFLAQTGPFSVPLKCRTRKCLVTVSPGKVLFPNVIMAETVKQTVTVTNQGALQTRFTISGEGIDKGLVSIELEKLTNILLASYGTTSFVVSFTPSTCEVLSTYLILQFQDQTVPQHTLLLDAQVQNVPVFVSENQVLDFNCCYVDVLYRNSVTVCNRGKVAMRASLEIPPLLKSSLEVVPQFGFVQPNSGQLVFQLKFQPTTELCARSQIDCQMRIAVSGQTFPVHCYIKALLTSAEITYSPTHLDFGVCSTAEARTLPLEIHNTALLPQTIGFSSLPSSVVVSHDVVNLLPGERRTVNVGFKPSLPKEYFLEARLTSHRNVEQTLAISGIGVLPKMSFSESRIRLAAVAIGETISEAILLTNNSSSALMYEFNFSKWYGIRISPACGEIAPKASETLMIEFTASKNTLDPISLLKESLQEANDEAVRARQPTPPAGAKPAGKKGGKEDTVDEDRLRAMKEKAEKRQQEIDDIEKQVKSLTPWKVSSVGTRHRNILLPCHIRGYENECMFLEVVCTVIQPTLVCDVETIEFGDICVLQQSDRTVTVKNVGKNSTVLSIIPLDPHGPFTILRPPAPLKPDESCEITLRFKPKSQARYNQMLSIASTATNKIDVSLSGRGLMPSVQIAPQGVIAMGSALAKDTVTRTVTFTNKSTFALTYSISFLPLTVSPFNNNGTVPFMCSPSRGTIGKGATATITVTFLPDHECEVYRADAEVQFGGSANTAMMSFEGNGWERGVYLLLPEQRVPAPPQTEDVFASLFTADTLLQSHPREQKYILEFNQQQPSHVLLVGNNKGPTPANGEVSIEGLTESDTKLGWKIDTMKIPLAAGTQQKVTITFNATDLVTSMIPVSVSAVTLTANVKVILKGGNPVSPVETYFLNLRGTASSSGL